MAQQLAHIPLLVDDYDKAIEYYTKQLNFTLSEYTILSPEKRWVLVTPKGSSCSLLLAKAATVHQKLSSATNPVDVCFCFYIPMILTVTISICYNIISK